MSDLEACYDRQLPRIGGIVQEMLGIERKPMKVFESILPIMEHHILTGYGISEKSHGSETIQLCGTGQGNSMSGAVCRDTSCLIFKYLENMRRGVVLKTPMSNKYVFRMIIAFVDDTDFYTSGEKSEDEMQRIIKQHVDLCEATGGRMQEDKSQMFAWQWKLENGEQQIEHKRSRLLVHEK